MSVKRLSAVVMCFFATTASAQSYQTEVFAGFSRDSATLELMSLLGDLTSWKTRIDTRSVGGRWHFNPVNTEGHPLAESAFLQKSSSISASYQNLSFGSGGGTKNWINLQLEYFVPNTIFYLAGHYDYLDVEDSLDIWRSIGMISSESADADSSRWGVTFGVTPLSGLQISTRYRNAPLEYLFFQSQMPEQSGYNLNLHGEYVIPLTMQRAVRLEASYEKGQKINGQSLDDTLKIGTDFHIDRSWSIGAQLYDTHKTGHGIRTRKFFSDSVSLEAAYFKLDFYEYMTVNMAYRL